jgi:hypothetical protein
MCSWFVQVVCQLLSRWHTWKLIIKLYDVLDPSLCHSLSGMGDLYVVMVCAGFFQTTLLLMGLKVCIPLYVNFHPSLQNGLTGQGVFISTNGLC